MLLIKMVGSILEILSLLMIMVLLLLLIVLKVFSNYLKVFLLLYFFLGEYVAPERVEKILRDVPEINEVFIYGDSLKNHCVGIVHLNPDYKVDSGTLASIISKFGKKNKLSAMEIPKKIHIINKPFS